MNYLQYLHFSSETLIVLSTVLVLLALVKDYPNNQKIALIAVGCSVIGYCNYQSEVPSVVVFIAALVIPVYCIFRQRNMPLLTYILQFAMLAAISYGLDACFSRKVLVDISLIIVLAGAFIFLV